MSTQVKQIQVPLPLMQSRYLQLHLLELLFLEVGS